MPRGTWTPKRERQYEHILESCVDRGRALSTCRRVAAATVNKQRALSGESVKVGCHCPRGTIPLKTDKAHCYDRRAHRSVRRTCPRSAR